MKEEASLPSGLVPTQPFEDDGTTAANTLRLRAPARAKPFNEAASSHRFRRESLFSDVSDDTRNSIFSATDDILFPKPKVDGPHTSHEATNWHSVPLAFAILPALGGLAFHNGSAVVTDVMLLGLAAVFLNWSIRLPWFVATPYQHFSFSNYQVRDWYHSSQSIHLQDHEKLRDLGEEDRGESRGDTHNPPENSVPNGADGPMKNSIHPPETLPSDGVASATLELHRHEILALSSCFLFPLLGAYLLHALRSQLSRPSEGLVSNFNLTIFLLASEIRPVSHLVKMIRYRTLHLQRRVHANPYEKPTTEKSISDLSNRLQELESQVASHSSPSALDAINKSTVALSTTEARRAMQPDIDALTRAVRRYEKRATLQTMQTESRLMDLEARLIDALSLAAAAAQNGQRQHGMLSIITEWVLTMISLPFQALLNLITLPTKTIATMIDFGTTRIAGQRKGEREKRIAGTRYGAHARIGGDRLGGKGLKKY
ncbi:MAG: hypothetical protein M1829_001747 [Trizodia sp. TS-e1964]|nr:MAG: hypothetical protein M1829_001747 [Trizodia sp. TS-e1964]